MKIRIHHFLLFSETPEITYSNLNLKFNLSQAFPISNFGYFKSGMLWMKNSYLEIVNYPKTIPAPNSNSLNTRFVGIALKTNLTPQETIEFLKNNNIASSEILNEDVIDSNGNPVNIAKIILIENYFEDFRVFFVFHTNNFFDEKEKNLPIHNVYQFHKCNLSIKNSSMVIDLFKKLGMVETKMNLFKTISNQYIQIIESKSSCSEINNFEIEINNIVIDILKGLND